MATPYRYVFLLILAACCAMPGLAQSSNESASITNDSSGRLRLDAAAGGVAGVRLSAPAVLPPRTGFFRRYGMGTYESPLGFGGRIATSLTPQMNLRVGGSFFSFTTQRTVSSVPFTANVRMQSEEAQVDWYPFHGGFHLSPGVMFGSSNRVFGSALIPAGNSLTLNGVTYYSGASDPIHASGSVRFRRTAPMLTVGWGNWVRHGRERHFVFPFEAGVAFLGNPQTALDFSGVACTDAGQHFCQDISTDPSIQANIDAERKKLQNGANWLRFYPIIAGGVVYRF
ncbi:MAG: hypothetical protein WBD10_10560 [Acidobacteriaceae bacterium]